MKYIKQYEKLDNDFMQAAADGKTQKLKYLIRNGEDINQKDGADWTALMYAANNGYQHTLNILIKAGADLDYAEKGNNCTALIFASFNQNMYKMNCVKLLIKAGANMNILNSANKDIFTYLTKVQRKEIIKEFPNEYEKYLMTKDTEKYNL